ncbi:lysophosphatidylserine lipase ABHD12 [Genypterus blacodes]|uniref:lysophosphatidylserine lipase ABHD12 n=1 Tax=Genypterus blacodes TaxID=154954 RepID=UPI003F764868
MRKRNVEPGDSSSDVRKERVQRGNETQSPWWLWLKRGLLVTLVIYILVPFMPTISSHLIKHLVYVRRIRVPFFLDLSRPADLSLNHTINMYLTSEEGISLGVWHTVPENQWKESQGKDLTWYQKSLGNGSPIFIYLHGDTGTRAASHRVGVANMLSSLGYHALVMDYRGFGDSTGQPTEAGVTTDALYLYNWVKARSGSSLVVFWGHSLGTGVTTNSAVKLMEQGVVLDGVILEGTFKHDAYQNAFDWFYWQFPVLKYFFSDQMAVKKIAFPNDENLKKMRSPLLFLHSEDDHLTPIQDVQQLYEMALSIQNSERVKMVSFSGSLGYLHNGLYKDPQTPGIIKQFALSLKDD